MKLFFSPASPFVRKVLATFIECGLREKVELVTTNPHLSQPEFVRLNPFSKVPALQLDDGSVLIESYFICEYIDALAGGGVVLPQRGQPRRAVLHKHMLGSGLMEASVLRRIESLRGRDPDRDKNLERQKVISQRALDHLEAESAELGADADLGNLCIAIALDYLDFRFAGDDWRKGRPNLVGWHEGFCTRPSLQLTRHSDPMPA